MEDPVKIQDRLVDVYLEGKMPISEGLSQKLLNGYLSLYSVLEPWMGRVGSLLPPETEEIAAGSAEVMEMHYNMPLPLFTHLLGPTMKYSMALWEDGATTLEEAQEAMMADLCGKAGIAPGQRVLDIGCGFGSFAEHVLRHYPGTRVVGLTLSRTQANYIRALQARPGHRLQSDRFTLVEDDFNKVNFGEQFDRIVSIGVFEHISNMGRALEKIRTFLSAQGRCLLHFIAFRPLPGTSDAPRQDPFVEQFVFPSGRIWSHGEVAKHTRQFALTGQWFLQGSNYRQTLEAWLANFLRNQEAIAREAGLHSRQLRLWELYIRACIAVFNVKGGQVYGNGQYLLQPVEPHP